MGDISGALENCLNPDLTARTAAEQFLLQCQAENAAQYFVSLAQELNNEERTPVVRAQAGIRLKNALGAEGTELAMSRKMEWLGLDGAAKTMIREILIATFASPQEGGPGVPSARHSAAQVTAKVAAIDVPEGAWPDLIGGLVSSVTTGDNPYVKQASLECLGYICEDMDEGVLSASSNEILTAVVVGMNDAQVEIKRAATVAMENSIEFIADNFEAEGERNVIMQAILQNSQSDDMEVKLHAFMCLVKVAEHYYAHLPAYLEEIFRQTQIVLSAADGEDVIALQTLEFWTAVCEEEAERIYEAEEGGTDNPSQDYMKQIAPHLIPLLHESLCKQEDEQSSDTWNLSQAAAVCLTFTAQAVRAEIVPDVMAFVTANIENGDWHLREAATMAFGCILDGPPQEALQEYIGQAVPVMMAKLQDENVLVRDTSAWALGKIAEFHGALMGTNMEMLVQFVQALCQSLKDEPRVAYQACYALHELGTAWEGEEEFEESYPISQAYTPMIQQLLEVTNRQDAGEANLRVAAYEAVATIIQHSPQDCSVATGELLPFIVGQLRQSFQMGLDANEQLELQGTLCGILNNIIAKLGDGVRPHSDEIMTLLLEIFNQKAASVQEEAIMCVQALADGVGAGFATYMDAFMPHLATGLQNWQETAVCRAAVGAVGDIARALEGNILQYCDIIVQKLLEALQAPNLDREAKPEILSVLGDIALATEEHFQPYMQFTMMMVMQAARSPLPEDGDLDLIDNINDLRRSVLEAITGIIQGLGPKSPQVLVEGLSPHAVDIVEFLKMVAAEEDTPEEVIKAGTGVLGDMCSGLGDHMRPLLGAPQIQQLCVRCQEIDPEVAHWATTKVQERLA